MDWIAAAFELLGLYLVGKKNRVGFLAGLACNVLWVAYVLSEGTTYGLVVVTVPLAFLNIANYRRWGYDKARG